MAVLAFFAGGVLYVLLEHYTRQAQAIRSAGEGATSGDKISLGLFASILVDRFVDGVVIGIGSTLNLLTRLALAPGFLITTVVKGIIPEANREGEPGFVGVLYLAGLSLYALMSFALN